MNKNLLIVCAGPNSLHKEWIKGNKNFDLFLVYYGDSNNDIYKEEADYYVRKKGTKFNIVAELDIPDGYDFIFVPDDDLYMETEDINKIFDIAKEHKLWLCQPSLMGYYSVPINLHRPEYVLRYTNYVEIIATCFNKWAFNKCKEYFNYNKSCWGIEFLWNKCLGSPDNKIAIIDEVIAIHSRPCFKGDYYQNNGIKNPEKDIHAIIESHNLEWGIKSYGGIKKNELDSHDKRFYPSNVIIKKIFDEKFNILNKTKFI